MGALWPAGDPMYYPVVLALIVFLTVSSYEFVEIPAQRAITAWRTKDFRGSGHISKASSTNRFRYLAIGALVTAVIVTVPTTFQHVASEDMSHITGTALTVDSTAPVLDTSGSRLTMQIESALAADSWPELSPSLDRVLADGKPDEDNFGCGNTNLQTPDCIFGTERSEERRVGKECPV